MDNHHNFELIIHKLHEKFIEFEHLFEHAVLYKNPVCKHKFSCFKNLFFVTMRSFLVGFGIKTGLQTIFVLTTMRSHLRQGKSLFEILLKIYRPASVKLGLFFGLQTYLLNGGICLLQAILKRQSNFATFAAGFIAALFSLGVYDKDTRELWGVYTFTRMIDSLYRHIINLGLIKERIPGDYLALFCFSLAMFGYSYFREPNIMPKDYYKFYHRFALPSPSIRSFIELTQKLKVQEINDCYKLKVQE